MQGKGEMILTERQVALRMVFRETIFDCWKGEGGKYKMLNVVINCDVNNKPRLNRGTGDWLVAKQEDVIANAI